MVLIFCRPILSKECNILHCFQSFNKKFFVFGPGLRNVHAPYVLEDHMGYQQNETRSLNVFLSFSVKNALCIYSLIFLVYNSFSCGRHIDERRAYSPCFLKGYRIRIQIVASKCYQKIRGFLVCFALILDTLGQNVSQLDLDFTQNSMTYFQPQW